MRLLAALVALALVTAPFLGCGVSASVGTCRDACDRCDSDSDCCGDAVCTIITSDGRARCNHGSFICKMEPK